MNACIQRICGGTSACNLFKWRCQLRIQLSEVEQHCYLYTTSPFYSTISIYACFFASKYLSWIYALFGVNFTRINLGCHRKRTNMRNALMTMMQMMVIMIMSMHIEQWRSWSWTVMITAGSNLSVGWHRVAALAEDDPSPLGGPDPPVYTHRIF